MAIKVGSAPDSWGVWFAQDPRQVPWHRFLDEVAQAGYRYVELGPLEVARFVWTASRAAIGGFLPGSGCRGMR